MQRFVSTTGTAGIDHVADEGLDLWDQFGISVQPAWAFINDDGTVTTVTGALGGEGLEEQIQRLLNS